MAYIKSVRAGSKKLPTFGAARFGRGEDSLWGSWTHDYFRVADNTLGMSPVVDKSL